MLTHSTIFILYNVLHDINVEILRLVRIKTLQYNKSIKNYLYHLHQYQTTFFSQAQTLNIQFQNQHRCTWSPL